MYPYQDDANVLGMRPSRRYMCQRCCGRWNENKAYNVEENDSYVITSMIKLSFIENEMNFLVEKYRTQLLASLSRPEHYKNATLVGRMIIFFEQLDKRYLAKYDYDARHQAHQFFFLSCDQCTDNKIFIDIVMQFGKVENF